MNRPPLRVLVMGRPTSGKSTFSRVLAEAIGCPMNVAPYQNGVTRGSWTIISGFSENLVKFIMSVEQ